MNKSTPKLEDVAAKAGVSTATVSRCLNQPEKVVPKTRERVMAAVEKLGYSPNFGARALASKQTRTIAAVIPTMENAIFAQGLQAFQEELSKEGFTLLVATSGYNREAEEAQIRSLVARGADGLLLIGHDRDQAVYDFLRTQSVPVLAAWAYDPAAPVPSVGFNNKQAMAEITRLVLENGHRDIAVLSAESAVNDRARVRLEGVRQEFAKAGLSEPEVIECAFGIPSAGHAFQALMQRDDRPSAVICINDVLAVGATMKARELGFVVPDQVSITGFADIELAKVVHPALTTVHLPHGEMGRQAARTLIDMARGNKKPESICLPTFIQERGSLAKA